MRTTQGRPRFRWQGLLAAAGSVVAGLACTSQATSLVDTTPDHLTIEYGQVEEVSVDEYCRRVEPFSSVELVQRLCLAPLIEAPMVTIAAQPEAADPELLRPSVVWASNERRPVSPLRCGGSNSFEAGLLVDGDLDTGWGASSGDGAGESVVLDFGRDVELSRVGLSPGYLRVAPRYSNDCRLTPAFEYNRLVTEVAYTFDDGSVAVQDFVAEPAVQEMAIEPRITRFVTVTILSTSPQVEDDDTILSEAVFYGVRR